MAIRKLSSPLVLLPETSLPVSAFCVNWLLMRRRTTGSLRSLFDKVPHSRSLRLLEAHPAYTLQSVSCGFIYIYIKDAYERGFFL